ncbi:hypothetical protein HDU78_002370 [Chytriomyces hyalinus]|nr:hypothetical protein HDU78_002370 [Chytriomyces hyalinus]
MHLRPSASLLEATALKERGNSAIKKGNPTLALSEYSKGLALFVFEQEPVPSQSWLSSLGLTASPSPPPQKRRISLGSGQPPPTSQMSKDPAMNRRSVPDGTTVKLSFKDLIEHDQTVVAMQEQKGNKESNISKDLELGTTLLSNRALAHTALRNYDLAAADASQVILLRPGWVKGYFRRAEAYLRQRKFSDALSDFEASLQREPTNQTIIERIARVRIHLEDSKNNLVCHQLSIARGDLCSTKSFLTPVQNMIFDFAMQMRNFVYIVGNAETREVAVVDPCWDIDGIIKFCASEKLNIIAAIITHYHIDHVGGIPPPPYDKYGVRVDGLAKLMKKIPSLQVYINPKDIPGVCQANPEISAQKFIPTSDMQSIVFACNNSKSNTNPRKDVTFQFLHTPGHTPGSQCVLVNQTRLLSGDTLFIRSCGRCDFSDSSPRLLGASLERLSRLRDDVVVLPGHDYGGEFTTIRNEKVNGLLGGERRDAFLARQMAAHPESSDVSDEGQDRRGKSSL